MKLTRRRIRSQTIVKFYSDIFVSPQVVLYFNDMSSQETCVDIALKDVMTIEEPKDALVTVYDYYNREETASVLYNMNS